MNRTGPSVSRIRMHQPGGMHHVVTGDANEMYSRYVGMRHGLPKYMSIAQLVVALSSKVEPHFGRLALRSSVMDVVDTIAQFAGWGRSADLATSRNCVTGETIIVSERVELVIHTLLRALRRGSLESRRCLAVSAPLEPEPLWTASYVWATTQRFGTTTGWIQTIDAIPFEKGGQTQRDYWNSVLPGGLQPLAHMDD